MVRQFTLLSDPALVEAIQHGAVGILPTDTLYGVVASAANPAAVAKLYQLKHREHKPGTTIAASTEQLIRLGIDPDYVARVAHLWPASLSVVLPLPDSLQYIHQGLGSSPFRVVADPALRRLLQQTGPLVTSSANQPGQPPATNMAQAHAYFGDLPDFYVDGGDIGERQPSTIIKLTPSGHMQLIRAGAVTIDTKEL